MRGSFGAMKKTSGISRLDASRASEPKDCTNASRLGVPALRHDLLVDLVADLQPARPVGREGPLVGQPQAAIERDPAHELRVDEVPPAAAHLPDALVLPPPVVAQPVDQSPQARPAVVADRARRTCCGDRPRPSARRRCPVATAGGRRCRSAPAASRGSPPGGRASPP